MNEQIGWNKGSRDSTTERESERERERERVRDRDREIGGREREW